MKKVWKVFAIVLTLALAISLAACNNNPAPAPTPAPAPAPAPTPAPTTPDAPTVNELGIPYPKDDYRVVFTMFNGQNPVAREIEKGFIEAAKSIDLNLWVMDNEFDPVKMNANVDMAVAAGDVDFYVLYTNHAESNPQLATKLHRAGIPILSIANPAICEDDGNEAPIFFSPSDNKDSAFLAAESLGKAAKAKGWKEEDCIFIRMGYDEAGGGFLIRNEGAMDGIRSVFPNIEIIESSSTGKGEVAGQRTRDILTSNPGKKILGWTHSDDCTGNMMSAAQNAGRGADTLLVSNGLDMAMLDMIRDPNGIIVGSIDLSFRLWGTEILKMAVAYLNDGTEIPKVTNAPYRLITPENVNEIYPK